jgi:hypothetical protein
MTNSRPWYRRNGRIAALFPLVILVLVVSILLDGAARTLVLAIGVIALVTLAALIGLNLRDEGR